MYTEAARVKGFAESFRNSNIEGDGEVARTMVFIERHLCTLGHMRENQQSQN